MDKRSTGGWSGDWRKQRAYQPVFLGNTDLVKIGQSLPNLGEMIEKARASPKDDDDQNGGGWGAEDGEGPSQETDGNSPRVIA